MRFLLNICISLCLTGTVFGQEESSSKSVYIEGQIVGAEKQNISLGNQNVGAQSPLAIATSDEKGRFVMEAKIPYNDYYFLRFQNGQVLNLILSPGDSIAVYGDCKNILLYSNIVGSIHTTAMNEFLREFTAFKQVEDSLRLVVKTQPQKQDEVNAYFKPLADKFYTYRNNFINGNTQSPALIVTFNAINQETEWELYKKIVELLEASFEGSPTVANVRKYIDQQQAQKDAMKFLEPGNEAREIALQDTGRVDTLRLSDLKGKVVLIDFWASWCRPCRAENPNVVRLYHKYNADGFEVFSVSLDADLARWKQAIQADGLVWPYHVSDLKKWGCVAARDYAVSSIPFTVLIDREGKIIATKLRGEALENQLKLIFGH